MRRDDLMVFGGIQCHGCSFNHGQAPCAFRTAKARNIIHGVEARPLTLHPAARPAAWQERFEREKNAFKLAFPKVERGNGNWARVKLKANPIACR